MDKFNYLGNADPEAIGNLYEQYKENPDSVEQSWKEFFMGFEFASKNYPSTGTVRNESDEHLENEFKVLNLITAYRQRGHLFTKTNPVRTRRKYFPTLSLENFDLSDKELESTFRAGKEIGIGEAKLKDIIEHLEETYCHSLGVEYLYIRHPHVVSWLKTHMEPHRNRPDFSKDEKKSIYKKLMQAVYFEQFIHKKFLGQKRFSLEGGETLIPALNYVIQQGALFGAEEFIIGMPHRGRLNVLANILKKPAMSIFNEFNGDEYEEGISLGDVKYHLGYGNDVLTDDGKKVHVSLCPNPSHLEAVAPIIEGIARGKIDHKYKKDYDKIIPIIIHGDSAIAGQGVAYEVVQMATLKGYKTGGTIHLVVNNQVGFTTNYLDARSSTYSTDVGKVTRSPVFHVNGDDVEQVVYTINLAMKYRQEFNTDVFIDILAYRKHGHNEGDEPRFTQPTLYKNIADHPNACEIYENELIEQGVYSKDDVKTIISDFNDELDDELGKSKETNKVRIQRFMSEEWKDYRYPENKDFIKSPKTGVKKDTLMKVADSMNSLPQDLNFFKKIHKLMEDRKKMVKANKLDWALAELLAYGTLVLEHHPVRISGQDSERGTFSHRHAALTIEDTDKKYFPLKNLNDDQGLFTIYNSPLNEYGVMGFEYGYALSNPQGLTIWEAQFGDFHNVGQVIIDQFLSSAEEKWGLQNGLVLYLPHGYEGQGPEHSSARIERFLIMSAKNNMQIVNCTTPANFFHVLRRQLKRDFQVPLVIFTPKSLLRHPQCVSKIEELSKGGFREVIDDENVDVDKVKRLVFCSGKVYYDLLAKKNELKSKDVAIIRLEQLHPFPTDQVTAILKKYKNTLLHLWVQEEPENMGAWHYIRDEIKTVPLVPVARIKSGSPATGLHGLHNIGQEEIVTKVFRKCNCELKNDYCGLQCVEGKSHDEVLNKHHYYEQSPKFSI